MNTRKVRTTNAYFLVEHPVAFVDVCNIALAFVVPLPREPLLLVDAAVTVSLREATNVHGTYSVLILLTTRSIASSLGLLSAYSNVFASRYKLSAASRCCTLVGASYGEVVRGDSRTSIAY